VHDAGPESQSLFLKLRLAEIHPQHLDGELFQVMFNATILHHFLEPYHQGIADADAADAVGQEGIPGEGPYMTVTLRTESERLVEGRFETYGCPAAVACGSWLMKWIEGKTVAQAATIETADIAAVLGGLPLGKEHCAQLAIGALRSALDELGSHELGDNKPNNH
jgi:nitrogen fixation NifU-like protein